MLVVKMSSMGDVIHALPAVTDAASRYEDIEIDWVVEEAFADIPYMHPSVRKVIPVAIRRWRKGVISSGVEFGEFMRTLRSESYDIIIDAQGLIKSAIVSLLAKGGRVGYDWASAREPLASITYTGKLSVPTGVHAVERIRQLFAGALRYETPGTDAEFGLNLRAQRAADQVIFLHGTTWNSKHWPDGWWITLARMIRSAGLDVLVAHGNDAELARAKQIAAAVPGVRIMDRLSIRDLGREIGRCVGVVSVDSGPGHLAAAVGTPMVALYGPTDPLLTGPVGDAHTVFASTHMPCIPCLKRECQFAGTLPPGSPEPPCFSQTTPARVWDALRRYASGS